ncbi:MAG: c-type cytochrome [Chloroflexi bacterium]|nr:c-type cytochrome [Chloroflexota bacterium]
MKLRRFVASAIALSLIAMACQVDLPPTAPPTAGTKLLPPPTVTAEPVEESGHQASEIGDLLDGQEVFATAGCAACHGEEAQGTDFAPGLAGHSIAQVKRQVRAPIGTMTVFPPRENF